MSNEKWLIDANALKEKLQKHHDFFVDGVGGFRYLTPKDKARVDEITHCIAEIVNATTVDAVEVVHARWNPIRNFGGGECYGYCTNCKTPVKADNATGLVMSNRFCHWCGAKMDGGNGD